MTDKEKLVDYLNGSSKGYLDLRGADLSGANLTGVDLSGADLRGADLSGANFTGVDFTSVKFGEVLLGELTRYKLKGDSSDSILIESEQNKDQNDVHEWQTKKTYPYQIKKELLKLEIGASVFFEAYRAMSVRQTISKIQRQTDKKFETRTIGEEVVATRIVNTKIIGKTNAKLTEKTIPNQITENLQQLEVGKSITFSETLTKKVRTTISTFFFGSGQKFKTKKIGDKLFVTRLEDKQSKEMLSSPKKILPVIKNLNVGESAIFNISRTNVIRSTINNYKQGSYKDFETKKVGDKLVVTRLTDISENNLNQIKINYHDASPRSNKIS